MKKQLLTLILSIFWIAVSAQKITEDIEIQKLSDKVYLHLSTAPIEGFGMVTSNGMIVIDNKEAFLFDTPTTEEQTKTLVAFIADSLHAKVVGFVPNHSHDDCVAGLAYLHKQGVTSYANQMTIDKLKAKQEPYPQNGFQDSLTLTLHGTEIACHFLGGGHSHDNIVVWIPSEEILFGGCMVKDCTATNLGNTKDADLKGWAPTLEKAIQKFPSAKIVIPGHGAIGGTELLEYTQNLILSKTAN